MKQRKVLTMLFLFATIFSLLSLSVATAQDTITLQFWSHDYAPRKAIDDEIIAQFEADNPNIKVEYTIGPGDDGQYVSQLLTAMAGGEGPDLFNVLTFLVPDLIPSGAVTPVDWSGIGYESQDALIESYLPGTLEGMMGEDGNLYAVPTELGNYALFINGDLFKAAGLDPVADAPKTWEDLLALAPKLTIKDDSGNITQRAFDFSYPIPDEIVSGGLTFNAMAYQLGGTLFNEDQSEATVNTEPWVKTYSFIRDYAQEFGGPSLTPSSIGFYEGNVAMVISGPWYSDLVRSNNEAVADAIVTAPLPRWADGVVNDTGSYLYSYGLFVNSQSSPEKQAAAWKLANALISQPERYFQEALLLQPRMSLVENQEVMDSSFASMFIRDMENSPSLPALENFGELPAIMDRAIQRILDEGVDVQESLNIANEEFTALLNPE
jgi:multiple sugar transport system substrate-binding protein